MTEPSLQALQQLRDVGLFQWYLIPLFSVVVYLYAVEIERGRWDLVMAGLAVLGIDTLFEIVNALFLHFSHDSAVWTEVGPTAFQLLVGLNIETYFMFAMMGIVFGKMLPQDPQKRILGIPNRLFFVIFNSIFCVLVEILLNRIGVLAWSYPWWNFPHVWLIVLVGYMPYFIVICFMVDSKSLRVKVITVLSLWAVNGVLLVSLLSQGLI